MKRNRNITAVSAILAVALAVGFVSYAQSNPAYVQDAETRLSSYLGNYYGPTDCSSKITQERQWQVICTASGNDKSFEFTVLPSEKAPYPVSRSFYLKANEANAEQAAQLGLMKYLQIDINQVKQNNKPT
ncbi:hypothetical protein [Enterobacter roggenkampii]|uniref:hypothetical protein n=1 Tax=Enterobacter roggenkampii TaxID=1812935 RepID=UPI003999DF91